MDTENFVKYCKKNLNLEHAKLSDEYYYSNLPLCVIDAVFSIGIKYTTTKKVVEKFCNFFQINKFRQDKNKSPLPNTQLSINEFIDLYEENGLDFFTKTIYDNRNRTSSVNGILKSVAVLDFLKVLQKYNVNYLQDINSTLLLNNNFKQDIKEIKGQGTGKSLAYFFMLAGNDNFIKPDRMIERFVESALGKKVSTDELIKLFDNSILNLKKEFPDLTLRELDHEIWKYQREL